MSVRSAGHVLLALAVLGAAGVGALWVASGSLDAGLGVVAVAGVLAAAAIVAGDRRRRASDAVGARPGRPER